MRNRSASSPQPVRRGAAAGGRDSHAGRRDAEVEHLPERVLKVHVVVVDRAPHVLLHPAVVCRGHANAK